MARRSESGYVSGPDPSNVLPFTEAHVAPGGTCVELGVGSPGAFRSGAWENVEGRIILTRMQARTLAYLLLLEAERG